RLRAIGLIVLIEQQEIRRITDIDNGGNKFATMDSVASRAYDLGHVGPHAIPTLSAELAPVARAFHGNQSGRSFIRNCIHVVKGEVGISQLAAFGVVLHAHEIRELRGAAQAANAEVLAWGEAADRAGENDVHAGPRETRP